MAEREEAVRRRFDMLRWLRTRPLRDITAGWGVLILVGVAAGIVASWIRSTFLSELAVNFVPDVVVAGLAFIMAEAVFGVRERQEQQAEEQRRVTEAQQKAVHVVKKEIADNERELDRIVQVLGKLSLSQWDPVFHRQSTIQTDSWKLLIQSPLIVHLPVDLVWALQESYYESQRQADNLRYRPVGIFAAGERWWREVCAEFLPKFEHALRVTRGAIKMLDDYSET